MSRYPIPIKTTYDQGSDFCHDFIKPLIEIEYSITAKPINLVNPTSNAILERIHHLIGNLVHHFNITQAYFDKDE